MTDLERAVEIYHAGDHAFVLVKDGRIVAAGARPGVAELLEWVTQLPGEVRGSSLADKIVGKAVAMLAVHAGITEIYTPLGSEAAAAVLAKYNIPFRAERTVPLIRNKRQDGPCPMEQLTLPITEPEAAVVALKSFVTQPRAAVPMA